MRLWQYFSFPKSSFDNKHFVARKTLVYGSCCVQLPPQVTNLAGHIGRDPVALLRAVEGPATYWLLLPWILSKMTVEIVKQVYIYLSSLKENFKMQPVIMLSGHKTNIGLVLQNDVVIPPSIGFQMVLQILLILFVQRDETVTKRQKLPTGEEKQVAVTRSRRSVQAHHGDIIGEQFWEEHPDVLEDDDNC